MITNDRMFVLQIIQRCSSNQLFQYDKFQDTISNLNFHAVFKYLQNLTVRDLLDAYNRLRDLWRFGHEQ
jgi:hypothetical protein